MRRILLILGLLFVIILGGFLFVPRFGWPEISKTLPGDITDSSARIQLNQILTERFPVGSDEQILQDELKKEGFYIESFDQTGDLPAGTSPCSLGKGCKAEIHFNAHSPGHLRYFTTTTMSILWSSDPAGRITKIDGAALDDVGAWLL